MELIIMRMFLVAFLEKNKDPNNYKINKYNIKDIENIKVINVFIYL